MRGVSSAKFAQTRPKKAKPSAVAPSAPHFLRRRESVLGPGLGHTD
jgi:hypothetical protein